MRTNESIFPTGQKIILIICIISAISLISCGLMYWYISKTDSSDGKASDNSPEKEEVGGPSIEKEEGTLEKPLKPLKDLPKEEQAPDPNAEEIIIENIPLDGSKEGMLNNVRKKQRRRM
ncbi:hypothetical protein NEFER02_1278 [Nematocida sp. LUAm2]|nr:hypothetical protein NEFER02_1278 [Nematocida sp. LUAm2]